MKCHRIPPSFDLYVSSAITPNTSIPRDLAEAFDRAGPSNNQSNDDQSMAEASAASSQESTTRPEWEELAKQWWISMQQKELSSFQFTSGSKLCKKTTEYNRETYEELTALGDPKWKRMKLSPQSGPGLGFYYLC